MFKDKMKLTEKVTVGILGPETKPEEIDKSIKHDDGCSGNKDTCKCKK